MKITKDDLKGAAIQDLLEKHLAHSAADTPAQYAYVLDLKSLLVPEITFWTAWEDEILLGCAALLQLENTHGEIKSMHTAQAHRGQGTGAGLIGHLLSVAHERGYHRVSLETGTMPAYAAARRLYQRHGFVDCDPFAAYTASPYNCFMTKVL